MRTPEVLVHADESLLARAVAARLVTRLVDAVSAAGHAHLVLTGGGIGTMVLAELAAASTLVEGTCPLRRGNSTVPCSVTTFSRIVMLS